MTRLLTFLLASLPLLAHAQNGMRTPVTLCNLKPMMSAASFPSGATDYWTLNEAALATRVDGPGVADFDSVSTVGSVAGINNNCAQFSVVAGVGNQITASATLTKPTDFSMSYWVRIDSANAADASLIFALDADVGAGINLTFAKNGDVFFYPAAFSSVMAAGVSLDAWHFVVGTCNDGDGTASLYIDGSLAASDFITGDPWSKPGILSTGTGSAVVGLTDEPFIFARELTPTEISDIWNGGTGRFGP